MADGRQQAHTTWWFLTRVPARYSLGFRMDLAFVLRSPGLAIYYLALDAILGIAMGLVLAAMLWLAEPIFQVPGLVRATSKVERYLPVAPFWIWPGVPSGCQTFMPSNRPG